MTDRDTHALRPARQPPRGLSLVEVVVSTAITAVLMVAALRTLSTVAMTRAKATDPNTGTGATLYGRALAIQMMEEILSKAYEEPNVPPGGSMGPGSTETVPGNRSLFDDVDDYRNYSESPPRMADGSAIPQSTGWTWSVKVEYINPLDPTTILSWDAGVKRIVVTVKGNSPETITLSALRGRAKLLHG